MDDLHQAFLLLGSNIDPETHLRRAIELLKGYGKISAVSRAWESRAVGGEGPNFLNACVLCLTELGLEDVIERIIRPAELAVLLVSEFNRPQAACRTRYLPRPPHTTVNGSDDGAALAACPAVHFVDELDVPEIVHRA